MRARRMLLLPGGQGAAGRGKVWPARTRMHPRSASACGCASPATAARSQRPTRVTGAACLHPAAALCQPRPALAPLRFPLAAPTGSLQIRCERLRAKCFSYRLAEPCPNGRCSVEADKSL